AIAAIVVASSHAILPSVASPTETATAMSARPRVTLVSRERGLSCRGPGAGSVPGSGRSHANGAAPSGSHLGGAGGPEGACGPDPGSASPAVSRCCGRAETSAHPAGGVGVRRCSPYQPASIAAVMRTPAPTKNVAPDPPSVGALRNTTTTRTSAVPLEPDARPRPSRASPGETSSPAERRKSQARA